MEGEKMEGHVFKPMQYDRLHCQVCKMTDWHTNHIQTFAGLETCDQDRAEAAACTQREAMEARLRSSRGDISARSGKMEQHSPLFIGTGDSPCLW
jgi:hypothetical protein